MLGGLTKPHLYGNTVHRYRYLHLLALGSIFRLRFLQLLCELEFLDGILDNFDAFGLIHLSAAEELKTMERTNLVSITKGGR